MADFGLDRVRAKIAASNTVKLHLVSNHVSGDTYAALIARTLGSVALATGDCALSTVTLGRRLTIAAKTITSASASSTQYDSGTATSGGNTTLTDSGKNWSTNVHAGRAVKITGGTGSGQVRRIGSNTATALTIETEYTYSGDGTIAAAANWTTNPDATSTYQILDDLHWAILDETDQKILLVTQETSNQVITSGNQINAPALTFDRQGPL